MPALYDKAKTTIEVLEKNMIKAIIPNEAFLARYSQKDAKSVIKLLHRAK